MLNSIPWWRSKGVIGGIVAVVAGVVGLSDSDAQRVGDLAASIAAALGGVIAIYGRVKAKDKIR